jgi:protein subunit release factor B
MVLFPVSEEKNRWLQGRMEALGIQEGDIEEKFIRSSGRGGQKVNKTSSCVYLRHIRTGIEVKCMKERSQSLNRFLARRELVLRIERLSGQSTAEDYQIKKIRKQKLRRKKRGARKYDSKDSGDEGQRVHPEQHRRVD